MTRRIAVRGIFIKDGKLLCAKLKPYSTAIQGDFWCTIGGGVDAGEPLMPALEREIFEETGIKPNVGNLLYVQQFLNKDVENIEFFFNINNVDDFTDIDLSKTTHGEEEIAEICYINTKTQTVLPKFLTEIDFSDFDVKAPTKFFDYL